MAEGTPAERAAAIDEFMAHNQKLVYLIARKHSFRAKSMSIADLMQEGNLGLHRAAEKFDYTRGFRFSTYASNWVIQAVIRGIYEQDRTIRIPPYLQAAYYRLGRLRRRLGRDPTREEMQEAGLRISAVEAVDVWMQVTTSLDAPLGDEEDGGRRGDIIPDDSEPAQDALEVHEGVQGLRAALAALTDKERQIITMRFGLDGSEAQSLDTIGKHFERSRERIRQIQVRALAKLRLGFPELRGHLDVLAS